MFLKIFQYFKLINKLREKKEAIVGWKKFVDESTFDKVLRKITKELLELKAQDITVDFYLKTGYLKPRKMFFKFPEIKGNFTIKNHITVIFVVYAHLSTKYYMDYKIKENGVSLMEGTTSVSKAFIDIAKFIEGIK